MTIIKITIPAVFMTLIALAAVYLMGIATVVH